MQLFVSLIISIHAAREGGDVIKKYPSQSSHISIHAAREGGDYIPHAICLGLFDFNPRRP